MQLNIKNTEVARLAEEVAHLAGESKTQAVLLALEERKARLLARRGTADRVAATLDWLQRDVWSRAPADELGRTWSKADEEALLGYGEAGA